MRAEAKEIELETLALDHTHVWDILYIYGGEVRLPRNRTERRELRALKAYAVVSVLMSILKSLQHTRIIVLCVDCALIA